MNRSRKNKKLSSFGCENFIKFWMLKVLTLQRKKKYDERCVGRIWHVENK